MYINVELVKIISINLSNLKHKIIESIQRNIVVCEVEMI